MFNRREMLLVNSISGTVEARIMIELQLLARVRKLLDSRLRQNTHGFPIGLSLQSFMIAVRSLAWQHHDIAGEFREMLNSL